MSRVQMSKEASRPRSPFYSRAYGGFTPAQESYYLDILKDVRGLSILDPMSGQGFSLSQLTRQGANVWLGDLNPAPLLLAALRDPKLIQDRVRLVRWMLELLARLGRKKHQSKRAVFFERWLAPSIRTDLSEYGQAIGLGLFSSPFSFDDDFWDSPTEHRFAAGIPVLAARSLACFRASDNLTWLKAGGLLRERSIYGPVRAALHEWSRFADSVAGQESEINVCGSIQTHRMDAEKGFFGRSPMADAIVTSPPYANRLDYTRMWAPETEVLAAMCGTDPGNIKEDQIGSTVVTGRDHVNGEEARLPKAVRDALEEIRRDPTEFSESYYYPFFRNYAVSVARALRAASARLKAGGTMIVFVRDTVRKDVLFPTGELVSEVLTRKPAGLRRVDQERRIIKSHVGFLRKASNRGLYGLAQQEWWLVFRKGS